VYAANVVTYLQSLIKELSYNSDIKRSYAVMNKTHGLIERHQRGVKNNQSHMFRE